MSTQLNFIKKINSIFRKLQFNGKFKSESYWESRYQEGGDSGAGSYRKFAQFKSEILNDFVKQNKVISVIEFGCGDGNQLRYAEYPSYLGYDVSNKAVEHCRQLFKTDHSKQFALVSLYKGEKAELALSLDVLYHLIENDIYDHYMHQLFAASTRFVGIYSSNTEKAISRNSDHIRHRQFTAWIANNAPEWELMQFIPNLYPYNGNHKESSFADFYFFKHKAHQS